MANVPQGITLSRHRDLHGREWQAWARRGLLAVPVVVVALALANVFGQHPHTTSASSSAASLSLYAPSAVRGGLIWEARFDVHATEPLRHARLVLASDWLEGNTVNTIEPSPPDETSSDGALQLELGGIPAGTHHLLFIQFQTDPTNVGRRTATATLYDGRHQLVRVTRTLTIFP